MLSQARLLKLLPIAIPTRLEGEAEATVDVEEVAPEVAEPLVSEQAATAVQVLPSQLRL